MIARATTSIGAPRSLRYIDERYCDSRIRITGAVRNAPLNRLRSCLSSSVFRTCVWWKYEFVSANSYRVNVLWSDSRRDGVVNVIIASCCWVYQHRDLEIKTVVPETESRLVTVVLESSREVSDRGVSKCDKVLKVVSVRIVLWIHRLGEKVSGSRRIGVRSSSFRISTPCSGWSAAKGRSDRCQVRHIFTCFIIYYTHTSLFLCIIDDVETDCISYRSNSWFDNDETVRTSNDITPFCWVLPNVEIWFIDWSKS